LNTLSYESQICCLDLSKVVVVPHTTVRKVGSEATFECLVYKEKKPYTVNWFHNNGKLPFNVEYINSNKIVIRNVILLNGGDYTCKIRERRRTYSSTGRL